jgi:hypothetical protein
MRCTKASRQDAKTPRRQDGGIASRFPEGRRPGSLPSPGRQAWVECSNLPFFPEGCKPGSLPRRTGRVGPPQGRASLRCRASWEQAIRARGVWQLAGPSALRTEVGDAQTQPSRAGLGKLPGLRPSGIRAATRRPRSVLVRTLVSVRGFFPYFAAENASQRCPCGAPERPRGAWTMPRDGCSLTRPWTEKRCSAGGACHRVQAPTGPTTPIACALGVPPKAGRARQG